MYQPFTFFMSFNVYKSIIVVIFFASITAIVIKRFAMLRLFPLQSMVISTLPGSAILFWLCQEVSWHGIISRKNIMRENSSFFQHHHFFHDKFISNNKSLQIYKRWYTHSERLFETVLDHKGSWIWSYILKREWEYFLVMIIYVILRTTFDIGLYSIMRSRMIRQ